MKRAFLLTVLIFAAMMAGRTQVGINADGTAPNTSAMLDVKSTTKGLLVPRMTAAQRNAISNPATGLLIYCTDDDQFYSNSGTPTAPAWEVISSQWKSNGSSIYYSGGNVGIGTANPLQRLHVNGKIVAEWGNSASPAYRFGDGSENTGLSSPNPNSIVFVNNSVQSGRIDASGRMLLGSGAPVSSAQLELSSTTRGFLPPRMTKSQRDAISSPATGLMIFNTTTYQIEVYNGLFWANMEGTPADIWRCGQLLTDTRDGKVYKTVQIGSQCWFAQNLNVGTRINGRVNQVNNGVLEKYCYDDLESNCLVYGGLYQWDEVMQYVATEGVQGICPAGWHIPTDAEWTTMTDFLGGEYIAGGKMKETGTTHWSSPNTGASNSSGFTALPGGFRGDDGNFYDLTLDAYFWSSSQFSSSYVWWRGLTYSSANVYRYDDYKTYGFSGRCLKD